MPLIRPEIQQVLRSAGILPSSAEKETSEKRTLTERLDDAGLGLDTTLEELAFLTKNTGNESLRAKCLDTVLKAHGILKDTAPAVPSFTIVIQNSSPTSQSLLPDGINPILLPRQLLSSIAHPSIESQSKEKN